MSNNSAKQRMTQLMEWIPTLSSKRKKRVNSKQSNRLLDGFRSNDNSSRQSLQPRRIKNG
jgi:hypothetical protein